MDTAWLPPRTTAELTQRYPLLVEKLVRQVLLKLQHGRLHANDQHEDVAQMMYIILDKPSGESQRTLLQQFDLERCPNTPESGWKTWLLHHVITKRTINILKEEGKKGKFNVPIHEDAETDEPVNTIPVDTSASPLGHVLGEEGTQTGVTKVNEFCHMLRFHAGIKAEEAESLINVTKLHAQGCKKAEIQKFCGSPARYRKCADQLSVLWVYYEAAYA